MVAITKEITLIDLKRYGEWLLVFTTILAAAGWVFSKETIQGMPMIGFMGLRFLLASIILLPLCYSTQQTIRLVDIPKVLMSGSLQMIQMILWILAIGANSSLGEGAFIMSLSILLVPLIAWLIFKEKPLSIFWISFPIAAIGLGFLSLSNGWNASIGQLWFLGSAIALALYFNINGRMVQKIAVLPLSCIQMFCTGAVCTIISLLFETWPSAISLSIWSWFAASVLIATILRYVLQAIGQKYVNVGNAAIIMVLEPIFTLLLSVIFYHEPMPWMKWLGCFLILAALLIYRGYVFLRTRRSELYAK